MIITTTETLRQYLAINGSVDIENLTPYITKAERVFLKPQIGAAQLSVFKLSTNNAVITSAIALAQEAVANYAYYLYLPIGAVQISDNGIQVVENENTKTATDKQFKELQRALKQSAHEALDELLEFMELNATTFTAWTTSNAYTIYKSLLVNSTNTFNSYYHIYNSRQTFTALAPTIKTVENQFIKPVVGNALVDALKTENASAERKLVKEYLQQSIVAFTIMKTVKTGMFTISSQGISMQFNQLPYEKTIAFNQFKNNDFLLNTEKTKQVEAEEYLKMAQKIIINNPSLFPEAVAVSEPAKVQITKTQSIIGI